LCLNGVRSVERSATSSTLTPINVPLIKETPA
jgi:hypothetical protein